jgi:cellulose/xylan binding protein with CBM9 domain
VTNVPKTLAVLMFLPVSVSWAGDLPFYAALKTRTAPRVDGVLDDACWRNAEKSAPFVALGGKPVEVKTRAVLCWDDKNLYVAFVCPEPCMKDLTDRIARGDVKPLEESVELFVDSTYDRYTYLQLRVGLLGGRQIRSRFNVANDLANRWTAAVHRAKDKWTVELAVPFDVLGSPPKVTTLWSFNANRQRLAHRGPVQWTCWSDTKKGFHSPSRFGCLVFADYRPWLRFYFRSRIDAQEQRMGDLALRYPQVADKLLSELERLDRDQAKFFHRVSTAGFKGEQDCRALFDQGGALVSTYEQSVADMRVTVLRDVLR